MRGSPTEELADDADEAEDEEEEEEFGESDVSGDVTEVEEEGEKVKTGRPVRAGLELVSALVKDGGGDAGGLLASPDAGQSIPWWTGKGRGLGFST